ncbi:unnamed protein product [Parnassius apollo]|uniref:(apollo) hypothetical protein n=1 Tax=Parnassius apollo TaxID=110799 RepID=A0A8S3WHT4_PARAO|nr:unnamed protein product [Parnassius apollo]
MWLMLSMSYCIVALVLSKDIRTPNSYTSIFREEQVIFSSVFNITSILVPADSTKYIPADISDIPSIFFTISDPRLDGGSCIYVLEGLAAYEVLEGGRDSTADYGSNKTIYFGAKDGLYKYDAESLSAKKFGPFKDDIHQLQKGNNTDAIFILSSERKIYKIEKNGTIKTLIQSILCAVEFVLDTDNNIYYISCDDRIPHIVRQDGSYIRYVTTAGEDFKDIKLLRPAFIMENCVPFFADGVLYILYSNGTSEKKDFYIRERPSAYSVDATLYLVAALNGKIYEFNVMEVLLKSMFGVVSRWPSDVTKIIMSIIESAKDSVYKDWTNILDH